MPIDEIHVWRIALNPAPELAEKFARLLSADERARAARFRSNTDRTRYVAAHAALRAILADYLHVDATAVQFAHGGAEKPALAPSASDSQVRFNLSHSHDQALVAVALGRAVGVDIEHARPDFDIESASQEYLSPREQAVLRGMAEHERRESLWRLWTCKEACVKATGRGLSHPLNSVEIALPFSAGRIRIPMAADPTESRSWWLQLVDAGPDYLAAVVAEGEDWHARVRRWPADAESADCRRSAPKGEPTCPSLVRGRQL